MSEVKLIVEKVDKKAALPVRKNSGDSGLDITFNSLIKVFKHAGGNGETEYSEDEKLKKLMDGKILELQYLERALIGTGIKATVGQGYPRDGRAGDIP